MKQEAGQGLVEVLVSLGIAIIIITALVITVITGLRNAQFAQNQAHATKLTQDGLEKIRTIRDRNWPVCVGGGGGACNDFSTYFASSCDTGCNFKIETGSSMLQLRDQWEEDLGNGFTRMIVITKPAANSINAVVTVSWNDANGIHESKLESYISLID